MDEKPKRVNERLARVTEAVSALDQACIKLVELQEHQDAIHKHPGIFDSLYPGDEYLEFDVDHHERLAAATQLLRFRLVELFTNLKLPEEYRLLMQLIEEHNKLK